MVVDVEIPELSKGMFEHSNTQKDNEARIHQRWTQDELCRTSQNEIAWTEECCFELDQLETTDGSYTLSNQKVSLLIKTTCRTETESIPADRRTETSQNQETEMIPQDLRPEITGDTESTSMPDIPSFFAT